MHAETSGERTKGEDYRDRLQSLSTVWWKRLLPVQAVYRWKVRRLCDGRTLEIGCGIGRLLGHLGPGRAVGVDHNPASVATARARGLEAYTPADFRASPAATRAFDHLLFGHVAEHLGSAQFQELVREYLPFLKDEASLVVITPQERGYASDHTHVRFVDFAAAAADFRALGFDVSSAESFPLPRFAGKAFVYNEFVVAGRRPRGAR